MGEIMHQRPAITVGVYDLTLFAGVWHRISLAAEMAVADLATDCKAWKCFTLI